MIKCLTCERFQKENCMRKYVNTLKLPIILILLLGLSSTTAGNAQIRSLKIPPTDSLIKWVEENAKLFESPDYVYQYAHLILKDAEYKGDHSLSARMNEALANWYYYNIRHVSVDSTLFHNKAALKYYQLSNNQKKAAQIRVYIASDQLSQNKLEAAQAQLFQAISTFETLNDKAGLADAFSTLSTVFYDLQSYKDGLKYGNKALTIYEELDLPFEIAITLFDLVPIHIALEELDIALERANRSIELIEQNWIERAVYTLARAYGSRGNVYEKMNLKEAALADHLKAYRMVKAKAVDDAPIGWEAPIGNIYFAQEAYQKALPFLEAGLQHDIDNQMTGRTWELKQKLSICYEKTDQLEKALVFKQAAWVEKDTLLNSKIKGLEAELQVKYETAEKEATINIQQTQLAQQVKIQYLTYGIISLLTMFLVGIFWNYQKNQTKNKQLQVLNKNLAIKNGQNELLLKEIHHRVKNNLELVKSLLALQSAQIEDPKVQSAIQASQSRVQSMGIIHQKLYQGTNLAAIEMKDYFLNLGEGILDAFAAEDRIKIDCTMEELELDVDTAVPIGLIVNELLTNALKYAFPKGQIGKIEIQLTKNSDHLQLKVKDDGIGKSKEITSTGTGFGTQLVALLTMQLEGTMEEKVENGTIVSFVFNKQVAA